MTYFYKARAAMAALAPLDPLLFLYFHAIFAEILPNSRRALPPPWNWRLQAKKSWGPPLKLVQLLVY